MLDAARFRKFYNFYTHVPHGADNLPERDNARRMAEKMAARAGMTLDQAEASITAEANTRASASSPFDDYLRRERASRERVWTPHPMETALRRATASFVFPEPREFDGWVDPDDCTPALIEAIRNAVPFPGSFREAAAEVEVWDSIWRERRARDGMYCIREPFEQVRRTLLERKLKGRAETPDDTLARIEFYRDSRKRAPYPSWDEDEWLDLFAGDMARLEAAHRAAKDKLRQARTRSAESEVSSRRSNAEKRSAVEEMLRSPEGRTMSLREIAERTGVHHQTVANIKNELVS
ncbi:hypothetical protein [Methylorubrum thiocyanatum]|uniref:hypothetical protein n=1 Tax=Methylorubrum thiocyanatum TaxID=47958 RepID=UPI00366447E6